MKRFIATGIVLTFIAGAATAATVVSNVFTEGFNSAPVVYDGGWGWQITGVSTSGDIDGIEGVGYGQQNNSRADVDGVASIIGKMSYDIGTVEAADVTYTFSGDFGWRYGTVAAASDLRFHNQTGFAIDGTIQSVVGFQDFNLGTDTTGGTLTNWTRSYTTVAADIGKTISFQLQIVDEDTVGTLTQVLTDDWLVTAEVAVPTETLVVSVRADGLAYYYNPYNGENGYVNNGGIVEQDEVKVGDTIGICTYEDSFYTFGMVESGLAAGQYRVNHIPMTNVYNTVSGNIGSSDFTRNILTNLVDVTLVDFAYDGTDFWFLADDGSVYANSATNAAFTFSNTVAGIYQTLSLRGDGLVAGATTDAGASKVVSYDGGTFTLLYSGGAKAGGVTRVSGTKDATKVYVMRADNLAYEIPGNAYMGNFGFNGTPSLGLAQGYCNGTNGMYALVNWGGLFVPGSDTSAGTPAHVLAWQTSTVGIAIVEVKEVQPGYDGWSAVYGLTGGLNGDDDGDDLLNIYEYGLGGDPKNAGDQGTLPVMTVSNGVVSYTHVMLTDTNADISYIVEQTPDLVNVPWSNAYWSAVSTNSTADTDFDEVEYQIPEEEQLFFRLRIVQP